MFHAAFLDALMITLCLFQTHLSIGRFPGLFFQCLIGKAAHRKLNILTLVLLMPELLLLDHVIKKGIDALFFVS